jgi:hypothetical protein
MFSFRLFYDVAEVSRDEKSRMFRPLDNASLGQCCHNASLRQCVSWMMCPMDVASLTDVSCHRAESEGFVTYIYECPLKSYLTQPSLGQYGPMFFQDPSVRDALSKGRLPGAPQARDASSETFSSETKQNGTEYLVHALLLAKDKL